MNYARRLYNQNEVHYFLSTALEFEYDKLDGITYKIIAAEKSLIEIDIYSQTMFTPENRDPKFKDDGIRWNLRRQIVEELFTNLRKENDDELKLLEGGALPSTNIKSERKAFIFIGLPASGKSGIANRFSDEFGAVIVDSDYAKRKLPEYRKESPAAASIVHEESSQIIWGFRDNPKMIKSLYQLVLEKGYNIVVPKIGNNPESLFELCSLLHNANYKVHLTLVSLNKREATIRAINRFYNTSRYVPLGLIFDVYGNDSCLSYFILKNKMPTFISSYGIISTNVPFGDSPFAIDLLGNNPANLFPVNNNVLI